MGCLKSAITFVILGLAVVGFFSIGGGDLVMNGLNYYIHPTQEQIEKKAFKVADLSNMSESYKIENAIDMAGIKAVITDHIKTEQKMAIVDPAWALKITKDDIKNGNIEDKISDLASKVNYPNLRVKSLIIRGNDSFEAFNQTVPYVKIKADLDGPKDSKVEGIIGVVNSEDGKSKLVISGNKVGSFDLETAEDFFKSIKVN